MGMPVPPPPLSKEEFNRRVANGARTFQEIDYEYWKFHKGRMRFLKTGMFLLIVLSVAMVLMFLICMIENGTSL